MPDAPCYVKSWAKAHASALRMGNLLDFIGIDMEGWCCEVNGRLKPVPDHASDAWLAGMVRKFAEGGFKAVCEDNGKIRIETGTAPYNDRYFRSDTLHAAICRAVLPEGEHMC